ncbi:MAG: HAD family hydrolase [Planctomycetota bacterium]
MLRAILFDLDATLYDPAEYYDGAFREICRDLAGRYARPEGELLSRLSGLWRQLTSRDPHLFDRFLAAAALPASEVPRLVERFHAHRPTLTLYPDARAVLDCLDGVVPMGLVTNGHPGMQRSKIAALGLDQRLEPIVCTGEYPREWRKPGSAAFAFASSELGLPPTDVLYVGDDPLADADGPRALGMPVVRLRRGEYRDLPAPAGAFLGVIEQLTELLPWFEEVRVEGSR